MTLFSDFLRASAPEWKRMQAHPFVTAVENDALSSEALRRYLIIECGFVDAATTIFSHALIHAPTSDARRALTRILSGLAGDQTGFFERAFARLGVVGSPWREPAPPRAEMLRRGMLGIAAFGGYAETVTAMLAAEWTYLTFCDRASRRQVSDPTLREWLELHVADPFRDQVAWLRGEVDTLGAAADASDRDRLLAVFRTALELEIAFHAACLDEPR
jgi:thiaminase/transcriptional activator TenA